MVRALAALLFAVALAGAAYWVLTVERDEQMLESDFATLREHAAHPDSTRVSARLLRFDLREGERVTFELCFENPPSDQTLAGAFDVAVFGLEPMRLLLRVPLDPAHLKLMKKNAQAACLPLGGGKIEQSGVHSLDVVWPQQMPPDRVRDTHVWARVMVRRELVNQGWFAIAALGVLGLLLAAYRPRPSAAVQLERRMASASVLVACTLLVALYGLLQLPVAGSTFGFLKGVAVAFVQVALVFAVLRFFEKSRQPVAALALHVPNRRWLAIGGSLVAGIALSYVARFALASVPSTGVAPIETFIAWPSGTLALALVGVIAPLAEEVFFRGYLYAVFRRWGEGMALALSTTAFTFFHLAQSWGNWGGVVAITLAGVGFGAARYVSGSVWIAALVHVVYNLSLSLRSFVELPF